MKKLFFALACAVGVLFTSCNSDVPGTEVSQTIENKSENPSALVSQLTDFNHTMILTRKSTESRGNNGFNVFLADAKGAARGWRAGGTIGGAFGPAGRIAGGIIGAAIVGGANSYRAYHTPSIGNKPFPPIDDTLKAYKLTEKDTTNFIGGRSSGPTVTHLYNIGHIHNEVLSHLLENDYELVELESVLTPLELEIVNNENFIAEYEDVVSGNDNIDASDGAVENVILNLYFQIAEEYPDSLDDLIFISNKYIEYISASDELTDEEKDMLYSTIDVAVSSYQFWEQRDK